MTCCLHTDSQIGAFSVVGLIFIILMKVVTLFEIPDEVKNLALLSMPVLGRWSTVILASLFNYARPGQGTGQAFVQGAKKKELIISTPLTVLIILGLFSLKGGLIVLSVFTFTYLFGLFFKKKIGGVTGDILGASCELTEVFTLLLICGLF